MVERFYTENGLPIDQDPTYDYENRFQTTILDDDTRGEGITLKLNDHREPRFYAWISFHNGFYECQTENVVADGTKGITYQDKMDRSDRKQRKRWLTQYKKEDNSGKMNRGNNYSPTGYLNKKGVHPGSAARKSDNVPSLRYPLPIIRLGELYLDYAELQAERKIPMSMEDWAKRLDGFLEFNGNELLTGPGKISAEQAKLHAETEYEKYRVIQDRLYESDFDRFMMLEKEVSHKDEV